MRAPRAGGAGGAARVRAGFQPGALRLDLRHQLAGNAEEFLLERLRLERTWPGPAGRLADDTGWGDYRVSVYGPDRDAPLYREGFDTSLPPQARAGTTRVSVRFPLPRRPVRAAIEKRRGDGEFVSVSSLAVDPDGRDIDRSAAMVTRVHGILASGAPASKADLAILGDGYREAEYGNFTADAERAAGYLFSVEPFRSRRADFNVSAVFAPSADSGVTDPYLGLKKDTVYRCTYGSGGSERTLSDGDNHAVREAASAVPYDFLLILANARRYGGSASFGGPAVAAIHSAAARYLVIHELAHAIAGLADEYYVPGAQGPAYAGNVEPWQPNVTIDPARGKWRDLQTDPALRPAAWNKTEYERYFADYVRRYERLRAGGAPEEAVEKFLEEQARRQAALLDRNRERRRVGYYEGANGYAKGVFRAEVDCIMFSLQTGYFCAACRAALERAIDRQCRP